MAKWIEQDIETWVKNQISPTLSCYPFHAPVLCPHEPDSPTERLVKTCPYDTFRRAQALAVKIKYDKVGLVKTMAGSFRNLTVYQKAFDLAMEIFEITK